MNLPHDILVATDFGTLGNGAVDHAAALSKLLGAQLIVISVYSPPRGSVPATDPELRELRQEMAKCKARLQSLGYAARTGIEVGEPAPTILRIASELRVGMIVMGTNSRKGFGRLLMGSTAQAVMRHAKVPVLVLRKAALRRHDTESAPAP